MNFNKNYQIKSLNILKANCNQLVTLKSETSVARQPAGRFRVVQETAGPPCASCGEDHKQADYLRAAREGLTFIPCLRKMFYRVLF